MPDAIVNYLLLLGWSLDDKTEFFTRRQMIEHFALERVNKASASFDPKKLSAFQDRYMQELPFQDKVDRTLPYLQKAGIVAVPASADVKSKLRQVVQAAGVMGGTVERKTPDTPPMVSFLRLGISPCVMRGFNTSHVAPSRPTIKRREAGGSKSRWP